MARRRSSGITSLGFNQDQGCFTCCLTSGLRVYNVEPLVEKTHYSKEELGEVSLCEMVFRTNWLLVVRARRPCSLLLLDDQRRALKAEVHFKSPIRALRSRKDKVAVVLSSSIQVLTVPLLARVALLRTPSNARPLCAMATDVNASQILVAPAHRRGSLQMLDVSRSVKGGQSSSPAVMSCHQNELVCLSVSPNGSKVATASARGTLIRVWDAASKHLLHELRRGSDYADVYCINFNPSGSLVCCVSDKGTVHVWAARGPYAHLASARAPPDTRALCAFADDCTAIGDRRTIFHAEHLPLDYITRRAICDTATTKDIEEVNTTANAENHLKRFVQTDNESDFNQRQHPVRRLPSICGFTDEYTAFAVCEDGTFHKFKFSAEGTCHRSDFDYFLQVGDDDEFMQ